MARKEAYERVLSLLPKAMKEEIVRMGADRKLFLETLEEIRLRAEGVCSLTLFGRTLPLHTTVSYEEVADTVTRVCHGSLYAYRDPLLAGYLPMEGGMRVGVCGQMRYDGGRAVGVSEIRSLVFRLPGDRCDAVARLCAEWDTGIGTGMLIFSPPGVGKTTALRALAKHIGSGTHPKRVCFVDEREECPPSAFVGSTVDVLSGYRRAAGLEISLRTLAAEVILMDEIGTRKEAESIEHLLHAGVPLIATAHAQTLRDVRCKAGLQPFLHAHIFQVFCGLCRTETGIDVSVYREEKT